VAVFVRLLETTISGRGGGGRNLRKNLGGGGTYALPGNEGLHWGEKKKRGGERGGKRALGNNFRGLKVPISEGGGGGGFMLSWPMKGGGEEGPPFCGNCVKFLPSILCGRGTGLIYRDFRRRKRDSWGGSFLIFSFFSALAKRREKEKTPSCCMGK